MLTINISWEFFLGIFGSLIALADYANGRLTRLDTNFDWLVDLFAISPSRWEMPQQKHSR
jgi:hypothetical protein